MSVDMSPEKSPDDKCVESNTGEKNSQIPSLL